MQADTAITPPLGHNNPPSEAELLQQGLKERQAQILAGTAKLLESSEKAPTECADEQTAKDITTLIKLIGGNAKALEGARVAEKEPHLNAGRIVDNFFKEHTDKLDKAKKKVSAPLDLWLKNQADAERKRRESEALAARELAQKELAAAVTLAESGHSGFSESALAQAAITESNASKLEASAYAKPAQLASARSATGTASLRTRWIGAVENRDTLDLEKLRQHIPADALQKAVNAFVLAGGRELRGAVIKEVSETVVR